MFTMRKIRWLIIKQAKNEVKKAKNALKQAEIAIEKKKNMVINTQKRTKMLCSKKSRHIKKLGRSLQNYLLQIVKLFINSY